MKRINPRRDETTVVKRTCSLFLHICKHVLCSSVAVNSSHFHKECAKQLMFHIGRAKVVREQPAGKSNKKVARGGGKRDRDGARLKAVGGVAVPEALPAEAVQPHHCRHWQVARHQRHQQAPVLRYEVFSQVCKVSIISISAMITTSDMSTLASL